MTTSADLLTLNYSYMAEPFADVANVPTLNLDYYYTAEPFVALGAGRRIILFT